MHIIHKIAGTILLSSAGIAANNSHATGPWNLGPFSTSGDFPTAQAACEDWGRFTLLTQFATLTGVKINYFPTIGSITGASAASCQAVGKKGDQFVETVEVSLGYSEDLASAIYDPAQCEFLTIDGACYVANDSFNYGSPEISQVDTCANGPGAAVGNPINIATGNKYQREIDIAFTAESEALELVRHYNSQDTTLGLFGIGWRSELASRIDTVEVFERESSTPVKTLHVVKMEDGRQYEFVRINGAFVNATNISATLAEVGGGYVFDDGTTTRYQFNNEGKISSITTPYNLTKSFNYTAAGTLKSVEDNYGNTISFGFKDGLIETAKVDNVGTYTYSYDAQRLTSVTFNSQSIEAPGIVKRYVYDDPNYNHLLTGIIDEENRRYATWVYDGQGRAVGSEHGLDGAEKVTVTYDSSVQTTVTNAAEKVRVYGFVSINGVKQVLRVIDRATENCPNASQLFSYSDKGMLETVTNGEGYVTFYERNDKGLTVLQQQGLSWVSGHGSELRKSAAFKEVETLWYSSVNTPEYIIVRGNNDDGELIDYRRTDYALDENNRISEITATDLTDFTEPYATLNRKRTVGYDYTYHPMSAKVMSLEINGARSAEDIEGGVDDITTLHYSEAGLLTSRVNALGHTTTYSEHTTLGLPSKITDANEVVTHLTYDILSYRDKVTIETAQGDAVTDYDYLFNGLLEKVTLPDNSYVQFGFNDARHLTSISNNYGENVDVTPNRINGEWTKQIIKEASGSTWGIREALPNELGQIMDIVGQEEQVTTLSYDRNNQLKRVVEQGHEDIGNLTTNYRYDALGRLSTITDANNGKTELGYNALGLKTNITNAKSHVTTYIIDGFGETIREVSPDRGVQDYKYDSAGNLVEAKDADGVVSSLKYDALNRLIESSDTKGGLQNWIYDINDSEHENSNGRVSQRVDASGIVNYSYNDLGLVASETLTTGDFTVKTSYEFDLAGNLKKLTYPGGRVVSHELSESRVSAITTKATEGGQVFSLAKDVEYAPFSEPDAITYGNGVKLAKKHDIDGRVDLMRLFFGSTTLLGLDYGYDNFNNVSKVNYTDDSARNKVFEYDALHSLDMAKGQFGQIDYGYDGVQNRTVRTITKEGSEPYSEDYIYLPDSSRLDRVDTMSGSAATSRSFSYDESGNVTGISGENSRTLKYDAQNQLQSNTSN